MLWEDGVVELSKKRLILVVYDVNLDVWSMGMSMKVCAAVLFF